MQSEERNQSKLKQRQRKKVRHNVDRPVYKLSVNLIETYKHINKVYYEKKSKRIAQKDQQQQQHQQQKNNNNTNNKNSSNTHKIVGASSGYGSLSSSSSFDINNDNNNNNNNNNNNKTSSASKQQQQQQQQIYNNGWDDEHYDLIIRNDEVFENRYKVKSKIGKGSFGQVVQAYDTNVGMDVAIKVIKSRRPFAVQAKMEIEILETMRDKDIDDEHNIVRLLDHFTYRGHKCLVFEMLSYNLYDLLKYTKFHGVSLNLLKKFAKQILETLNFLSKSDIDIIHCDLKPENILLRHPKRSAIKVIDFGSSCRSNEVMYSYIQSRFYRSPEVLLGLPYSVAIDMWSLGCVLVEMHTGEPLFGGIDQFDHMKRLVEVLGMPPEDMIDKASNTVRECFFTEINSFYTSATFEEQYGVNSGEKFKTDKWQLKMKNSKNGNESILEPKTLTDILSIKSNKRMGEAGHSPYHYASFMDMIGKMLAYDPAIRITPSEALQHPFLFDGANSNSNSNNNSSSSSSIAKHRATKETVALNSAATYQQPGDTLTKMDTSSSLFDGFI